MAEGSLGGSLVLHIQFHKQAIYRQMVSMLPNMKFISIYVMSSISRVCLKLWLTMYSD